MRDNAPKVDLAELSHIPRRVGDMVQKRINALKIGQKMQDLPEELWHKSFKYYVKHDPNRNGGPNLRMIRLDPSQPSLTVTGYIFNKFVHPTEDRFVTPREAARLQGFPDDFLFVGTLTSVQRQVGNAVPVQLAQAVSNQILEHIEQHRPFGLGHKFFRRKRFPVLSLFTGAGGMELGMLQAMRKGGMFDVKVCVEYDQDCCGTLRKNFGKDMVIAEADIQSLDSRDVFLHCGMGKHPLPLIIGGPPCQSFSQAGKQKGTRDPRGKLIFEFLRFVREIQPIYFVMENVSNLKGVAKGQLLEEIKGEIDKIGYNFTCNLLCAADYGAPQLRRRLVFIGVRKPYPAVQAPFPTHCNVGESLYVKNPYVTVGDAFRGLPSLEGNKTQPDNVQVRPLVRETLSKRSRYRTRSRS